MYRLYCSNCHNQGAGGAPKLGVRAEWAARAPEWTAVLTSHAIGGFITMAPKGGFQYVSDQDVASAVEYMAGKVKSLQTTVSAEVVGGMRIYLYACSNCHDNGLNAAPRLGDSAAWPSRSLEWKNVLKQHAVSGFVTMAPKGGFRHLSDEDVAAAVDYMADKAKQRR